MPFDVIPAIDLRGGRVVRLRRGDFGEETIYDDDPGRVASGFVEAGATWIHRRRPGWRARGESTAAGRDRPSFTRPLAQRARCEVAGGLRTGEDVAAALAAGATRVVVGTALLADPDFARQLVDRHSPDRSSAAIDVRDGDAVGEGWRIGAAGSRPRGGILRPRGCRDPDLRRDRDQPRRPSRGTRHGAPHAPDRPGSRRGDCIRRHLIARRPDSRRSARMRWRHRRTGDLRGPDRSGRGDHVFVNAHDMTRPR